MRIQRALPLAFVLCTCAWAQTPMPVPAPMPTGLPTYPTSTPVPDPTATVAGPMRFGFLGSLAMPMEDLRDLVDGKPAFMLGAFVVVDMTQGRALRPRLDWFSTQSTTTYQGPLALAGGGTNPIYLTENKYVKGLSLGCDYLYHTGNSLDAGLYLQGGAGLTSVQFGNSVAESATGVQASDNFGQRSTAFYWSMGLGYQVSPLIGVEGGYRQTRMGANLLNSAETSSAGGTATGQTVVRFMAAQTLGSFGVVLTVRF